MTYVIIILAIALVVSLAINMGFMGGKTPVSQTANNNISPSRVQRDDDTVARLSKAESDLEKKRRELEEVKKSQAELRDELKNAKKRLHDARTGEKDGDDLKKARADVERQASVQLDATRAELSSALSEVQKLKADLETRGKKTAPREPVVRDVAPEAPRPAELPVQRVIRELSDTEKERLAKWEQQSTNDRRRAAELEREVRNLKARADKQLRDVKLASQESTLASDKFRAVEKRLNRTLLENDLLRRAISSIEAKTGLHAERTAPTAEEFAESDRAMVAKHAAEDQAAQESRARLEAQHAKELEAEHAAAEAAKTAPTPEATPAPSAPTPTA